MFFPQVPWHLMSSEGVDRRLQLQLLNRWLWKNKNQQNQLMDVRCLYKSIILRLIVLHNIVFVVAFDDDFV